MNIYHDLKQLKKSLRNPVLTIGNFDGVHKAHLTLFDLVKERSGLISGQSVVMTFEPHPVKIMSPENAPPLITPIQQKLKLINTAGMDVILCLPFNKEFAAITAKNFVREILIEQLAVKELVVGYDYTFGSCRGGNIELLHSMGKQYGFRVHIIPPVIIDDIVVSSTSIRRLVKDGNLDDAKKLLGRNYQICGTVVQGKNRGGRLLGFPTANLRLIDELTPKPGVYAVKVLIDGEISNGLTNIGFNPTFGKNPFSVETHILDFSKNLLGRIIKVIFVKRLRDEKAFESIEDLTYQISQDIIKAREIFRIRNSD